MFVAPRIDTEYQQELQGIAEGLECPHRSNLDVYDIVAMNAFEELPDYYVPWLNKREKAANPPNLKSRKLQRVRGHRQLDERRQDRDRAQQLDELHERRAVAKLFSISSRRMAITC